MSRANEIISGANEIMARANERNPQAKRGVYRGFGKDGHTKKQGRRGVPVPSVR